MVVTSLARMFEEPGQGKSIADLRSNVEYLQLRLRRILLLVDLIVKIPEWFSVVEKGRQFFSAQWL